MAQEVYPVLELLHHQRETIATVDRRLGQADLGRTAVQMVAGGRAFRIYHPLTDMVGLNSASAPNLRGMVQSAKWRTIFQHTSEAGEYMENIGYLAAFAAELAHAAPRIDMIMDSSDSAVLKGMQLSGLAGTIAQRVLMGVVPAGAHLMYLSLQGWCMLFGLAGGKAQAGSAEGIRTLHSADTLVNTTFQTVTDTDVQSKAVWTVINFFTKPRSGSRPAPTK